MKSQFTSEQISLFMILYYIDIQAKLNQMGNFLNILLQEQKNCNHSYIDCPFSKLRQYYSSFKSICDQYNINTTQFVQIFGPNVQAFKIWDINNTGKIDGIQMFSGLILFSTSRFEDKLKFLFEMFDLNEEQYLSYEAIQFLLINCCNAVYKLFKIKREIEYEQIEEFVGNYFWIQSQITLQDLINWSSKVTQIHQFFEIIKKQLPVNQSVNIHKRIKSSFYTSKRETQFKKSYVKHKKRIKLINFDTIKFFKNLTLQSNNSSIEEFNPKINWVYGIRTEDIKQPLKCIAKGSKAINEKIIYFISCLVIIYFPKLNIQKHYCEHRAQISCLSLSENNILAASGEIGNSPNILIWNIQKLTTLKMIKGIHKNSICEIKFFNNDKFIISFSKRINPPLTINNIQNGQTIFSICMTESIICILTINMQHKFNQNVTYKNHLLANFYQNNLCLNSQNFFFTISKTNLTIFYFENVQFSHYAINLTEKITDNQEITATYLTYDSNKMIIIFIGYENGIIKKIIKNEQCKQLIQLEEKIVSLAAKENILFALVDHKIYMISISKLDIIKIINPYPEYYQMDLIQIVNYNQKSILLLSLMGDVIELSNLNQEEIKYNKIRKIFKIENLKNSKIKQNQLYCSSQFLIFQLDLKQKQLRQIYHFEKQIQAFQVLKDRFFISSGKQIFVSIYNEPFNQSYKCQHNIVDIYAWKSYLIIITQIQLELFSKSSEKYFEKIPKIIKLQNYTFDRISPTLDQKIFLISTKQKKYFKFNLDLQIKQISSKLPIQILETYYQDKPILFSQTKNYCLIPNDQHSILFWNNTIDIESNINPSGQLNIHFGKINSIHAYQTSKFEGFITVGSTDQLITLWQNKKCNNTVLLENKPIPELIMKQLDYPANLQRIPEVLKDSQIFIKGTKDNVCDKLIHSILFSENSKIYEPLIEKDKNINNIYYPPSISLQMDYVFGFQSAYIRKSLYYSHHYISNNDKQFDKKENFTTNQKQISLKSSLKDQIMYSEGALQPYTQSHSECKRFFIYFTNRICIRYCPQSKQQHFYQEHKSQITCLNIHPKKYICCSCSSPFKIASESQHQVNGQLHIWDTINLKSIKQFKLISMGIPKRVEFSKDGRYIAVLVILRNQNNNITHIQIYDWQNELLIAIRSLNSELYLDFQFNPYKSHIFAVVGLNLIKIYSIQNKTILLKERAQFKKSELITCLVYISNSYGNVLESDILTGNQNGDIGLFMCGNYIIVKPKAHQKLINCIKMGELFKYKTILMTSGQDQILNIWDTKFNIINSVDIKNLSCFSKKLSQNSIDANYSVQSIDLYHCDSNKLNNSSNTILLVGTRHGAILEISINNQYKGLDSYERNLQPQKSQIEQSDQSQEEQLGEKIQQYNQPQKIYFDYHLHLRNYNSEGKIFFAMHKQMMITFTKSFQLEIWNLKKLQIIQLMKLSAIPNVGQFSNSGQLFTIGYLTGDVEFYEVNQDYTITFIYKVLNPDHIVLNIVFSERDYRIAISYFPQKMNKELKAGIVSIFVNRYCEKKGSTQKKQYIKFQKMVDIANKGANMQNGVYFMNFSSGHEEEYILLYYQNIKNKQRNSQIPGRFLLWNLQKNQMRKSFDNIEFKTLHFSNIIQLNYNFYQFGIQQESNLQNQPKFLLNASNMGQYQKTLILGTTFGEVVLAKSHSVCNQPEEVQSKDFLSKYYKGHTSEISLISILNQDLYTAGRNNNNIIKWKIIPQQSEWDYDNLNKKVQDKYCEELSEQRIKNLTQNIFPKRKNIYDIYNNQSRSKQKIKLKLRNIFGRNALWTRNNLFFDYNDVIITYSGCNLILISKEQQKYKQQYIKLDDHEFSTLPEISCIILSNDRKLIAAGTCSDPLKIILWDIQSKTTLQQITLKDMIQIRNIKISSNNKKLIALGITRNNTLMLIFIGLEKNQVLACHNFKYSANIKIHDMCFLSNEQSKFITCGLHHMAQWTYNCGTVNYHNYKIKNTKDFTQFNKQQHQVDPEIFNIYVIVFVKQLIITGAADGYVYIWKNKQINHKQNAHPKQAILAMYSTVQSKILATGGTDGKVYLWQLGLNNVMQKIYEYSIYSQFPISINYHIQSICIGRTRVLVGTRSGQIYEFNRPDEIKKQNKQEYYTGKKEMSLIFPSFNHDEINTINFSSSSKKLYILTKSGNLSIFEMQKFTKIFEKQFDVYDKEILKMIVCQLQETIFIIYKDEVRIFTQNKKDDLKRGQGEKYKKITHAVLSTNQKYLALLLAQNQTQNAKLYIYQFSQAKLIFSKSQISNKCDIIENLSADIEYIDFSTDNCYLVYKSKQESENIIELQTKQKINPSTIQSDIEWSSDAKKFSNKIKNINSYYNEENKLLKIAQIKDDAIVATDEMGSIRIYDYPVNQCYFEHLNNINYCCVSPDSKKLVTVSEYDKNIYIWDIESNKQ